MLLHDKLIERAGPDAVRLGHRVTGYRKNADGCVTALIERADGSTTEANGTLLIGADGINSAVRAQMHPTQPPIHWGGAVMWRGTTWGKPIRTGSSFVGLGTHRQRVVFYPISHPDPATGLSMINWIAEVTMDNSEGWKQSGWFRQVETVRVRASLRRLGVGLARRAGPDPARRQRVREPDDRPRPDPDVAGRPGGADGRRRAPDVSDRLERRQPGDRRCARAGRCMVEHGVTPAALEAFDKKLCGPIGQVVLRNRGAGPFGLLNMVDERCGGTFENIDDVIPPKERAEFMAGYKAAAGFAIETLNKAPRTIPNGARARAKQNA